MHGTLVVPQTSLYPPGAPTLSGTVTEMTAGARAPIAGALVSRGVSTEWQFGVTAEKNGFYKILERAQADTDPIRCNR